MEKEKEKHCLTLESKIVLLLLGSIVLFWSWFFIFKPIKEQYSIKSGDVYIYEIKDENPFNESKTKHYLVIDKRGNYVRFVDINTGDTMTMKINTFLHGSEKLKK